jgi:type I restriction enzyme M protein
MTEEHVARIINTYRERPAKAVERFARRVDMSEIEANEYNLNISRYVRIAQDEIEVDLNATHVELVSAERDLIAATAKHNVFLKELGLPPLPYAYTD